MATRTNDSSSGGFLSSAMAQLMDSRWRGIALLLFVFMGTTNALLALYKPEAGHTPGPVFALIGLVRVLALISISVAALRIATASPRRTWAPDGGFWTYLAMLVVGIAWAVLGARIGASFGDAGRILGTEIFTSTLGALLAVWGVALAVERPLALDPAPRFRGLGVWFPPVLLWSLLLVVPLACLHAYLSMELVRLGGEGPFWALALTDALASTLLVLFVLSLHLIAYRRVARP
jgi:hypothetical protein